MGLPVFILSGLSGEIQRSPYHEWKDSESGHVMSYNQKKKKFHSAPSQKEKKKLARPPDIPKLS